MTQPPANSASDGLVAEIAAIAARPLERATTLPPAAYTDEAFFDLERTRVFRSGWLCVAHVSEVPEAGTYLALDLLDEPLAGMGAADTTHMLVTSTPVRVRIDPTLATHIRTIRNGAADIVVSFRRVR